MVLEDKMRKLIVLFTLAVGAFVAYKKSPKVKETVDGVVGKVKKSILKEESCSTESQTG
jgi:hypothetical protein